MRRSHGASLRLLSLALVCCLALPVGPVWAQNAPPPQNPPPPAPQQPVKQEPPASTQPTPPSETAPEEAAVAPAVAAGATLKGTLFSANRHTPLSGAQVHAISKSGQVFSSPPSDAKGHYRLEGVPPGTYKVALSTEEGVYSLENEVGISSANVFSVDLAAIPAEAAQGRVPGLDLSPRGFAALVQGSTKGGGGSFWWGPKGLVLLGVSAGALAFILSQSGGESNSVSPSLP